MTEKSKNKIKRLVERHIQKLGKEARCGHKVSYRQEMNREIVEWNKTLDELDDIRTED